MKIIALDGNENQAVACVRSLARAGHHVIVGAPTAWSKAGWPRYCKRTFVYPAPDVSTFVERVVQEARREPGALVMPMTERTTLPLSAERERVFAAGGHLALPAHETMLRAFDKRQTTRLASELGIPVPRTALITERDQIEEAIRVVGLPAVLKPRSSEAVTVSGKVRAIGAPSYARTREEFVAARDSIRLRCCAVNAQEFVLGRGEDYFALIRSGAPRGIRAPPHPRPAVDGVGQRGPQERAARRGLRRARQAILRALNWHGVAMVEFLRRPDGGLVFRSSGLCVRAEASRSSRTLRTSSSGGSKHSTNCRTGSRPRTRNTTAATRGAPPHSNCSTILLAAQPRPLPVDSREEILGAFARGDYQGVKDDLALPFDGRLAASLLASFEAMHERSDHCGGRSRA